MVKCIHMLLIRAPSLFRCAHIYAYVPVDTCRKSRNLLHFLAKLRSLKGPWVFKLRATSYLHVHDESTQLRFRRYFNFQM